MLKGAVLAVASVALFILAESVGHEVAKQFVQIVAAGLAVLCFVIVTKECKK